MSVKSAILSRWFAPRIQHRLPGRVRISVPLLRRVPDGGRALARQLEPLFLMPEGMESVQVGFLTGNLLVRFDTGALDERQVLRWTTLLYRLMWDHWDRLCAVPGDRVPAVIDRVRTVLSAAMQDHRGFSHEVEIPPDVWA
jgi:hypothetical protein